MRLIRIKDLKGNEVIAKSIFDENGRVLLNEGAILNEKFIARLKSYNLHSIYISDELSHGIESENILSEQTKIETKASIKKIINNYFNKNNSTFNDVLSTANSIIDDILSNKDVLVNVTEMKTSSECIFTHSINVCSLATITALHMGMTPSKIKDISVGAILHDIGKIRLLKENNLAIDQQGKLSENELKKHPKIGYDLLNEEYSFSSISKIIVLTHHELIDGSGYPLKLKGNDIYDAAKLVCICNAFENAISTKSNMQDIPIHQITEFFQVSTDKYDQTIVMSFIQNLALFPNGTTVELNNGFKGIVSRQNNSMPSRPVVRVVFDDKFHKLEKPYEIDLLTQLNIFIVSTIKV